MNNTQESLLKKNSITISSLCYEDEVELNFSCEYELIERNGKHILIKKKPKYPKTYEEDNYCETLEIKVLGYKVGDVVFANSAGWIRITNKLWDCYAEEHVYEGIGVLNEHKYDNISHKDIITKMETDSVIENMKESITPSPHITANITEKNNCDIECPDMLDADKNLFHTIDEYEEIVEKSFQGGYEKCKLDIQLNGYELPEGYHFTDGNENVIDAKKILLVKNAPSYPKTYDECCDILDADEFIGHELMREFPKLLNARNAYWKIAGEQMRLGKPWEPDWTNPDIDLYVIINIYNQVDKAKYGYGFQQCILTFPTEEMRDAFYENFKELIENCKELL